MSAAEQAGSSPIPTAWSGGMPRLSSTLQGLLLKERRLVLLTTQPQQLSFAGDFTLKQPGRSGLLPILAPVLERSSLELAQGCPCGLRCRQLSCVTQPSVRLNSGVTQRRFRPSLRSSPFHCRLTSNSHVPAASAWVQMAGRGPAGAGGAE